MNRLWGVLLLLPTSVSPAVAALRRDVARATETDSSLFVTEKKKKGKGSEDKKMGICDIIVGIKC